MSSIPIALPKSMLPSPDGATSAGVSSQWIKVLPNNVASITSADATVASSLSVPTQITLGAQQINFSIPTGAGSNVFCDTAKSTVSFRVRYQLATVATTAYTGTIATLQSSAHSFINRISTYVAGNMVDDVVGYDIAMAEAVNWGYDVAQRDSQFQLGLRAEQDGTSSQNNLQGHAIPAFTGVLGTTSSSYYNYEIPFCNSLLGVHNRSMCPVGKLAKTEVSIYTPQLAPVAILNTTTATGAGAVVRVIIDQISLNLFYITLDEPSMRLLAPKGEHYMAGTTYRVGSGSISSGTSGSVSVQVPLRVKSCRSLATRFSESLLSATGSMNGIFDAKMPLCSTMNYFISSQKRVPPNPHNTLIAPATVYSRALMANYDSAYESWKSRSGMVSDLFLTYTATGTAPTSANADQRVVDAGSGSIIESLGSFSFAEDLRSASSANFLSGQDMTTANSFLELNINNAPTNSLYLSFIAKADIIFVVLPDGSVESRV